MEQHSLFVVSSNQSSIIHNSFFELKIFPFRPQGPLKTGNKSKIGNYILKAFSLQTRGWEGSHKVILVILYCRVLFGVIT